MRTIAALEDHRIVAFAGDVVGEAERIGAEIGRAVFIEGGDQNSRHRKKRRGLIEIIDDAQVFERAQKPSCFLCFHSKTNLAEKKRENAIMIYDVQTKLGFLGAKHPLSRRHLLDLLSFGRVDLPRQHLRRLLGHERCAFGVSKRFGGPGFNGDKTIMQIRPMRVSISRAISKPPIIISPYGLGLKTF
jgi:hypothetical protein